MSEGLATMSWGSKGGREIREEKKDGSLSGIELEIQAKKRETPEARAGKGGSIEW